jgi:hypothetical protein
MATYGATFDNYSSDQSSKQHSLSFQHLKEITNSFSAEQVLRSGIFGVVYKVINHIFWSIFILCVISINHQIAGSATNWGTDCCE